MQAEELNTIAMGQAQLQQSGHTPPEIPVVPHPEPEIPPPFHPEPEIPEPPPDPGTPAIPDFPEIIPEPGLPELPPQTE